MARQQERVVADQELATAFTETGIRSLVARVNAARQLNDTLHGCWTVGPAGDELTGYLSDAESPPGRYDWFHPTIHFTLPGGSIIGDELAERHRHLAVEAGRLTFERLSVR